MYSLGEIIRKARKEKKLTTTKLAESLDLTQGYISHIENNRKKPSHEILNKLALELDVPYFDLMAAAGYIDDKTLIDTIISKLGATTLKIFETKELINDYQDRAQWAIENNSKKRGYTAEDYLRARDEEFSYLKTLEEHQTQLIEQINNISNSAEEDSILVEIIEDTFKRELYKEEDIVQENMYIDLSLINPDEYKLLYKGNTISKKEFLDVIKFIETFIISKK